MSKGLEALKRIRQETCPATYNQDFDKNECCDIIEQELKDYEKIKDIIITARFDLDQVNKEHKALKIIKETRVDTNLIKLSKDYDDYCAMETIKLLNNAQTTKQKGIVPEEYQHLKEVLGNE